MSTSKEIEESKNEDPEKETNVVAKPLEGKQLQGQTREAKPIASSVICANCKESISGDKRFCIHCGHPTGSNANSSPCPVCGDIIPIGTSFCGNCGFRASSPVSFSGTGTLSFGIPNPTTVLNKQNKAWLGAGIAATVLFLVGLGYLFGSWFHEQSAPKVVLNTSGDKPSPIPPLEPKPDKPLPVPSPIPHDVVSSSSPNPSPTLLPSPPKAELPPEPKPDRPLPAPSPIPHDVVSSSSPNPSPTLLPSPPKAEPQPAPLPPPAPRPQVLPGSYKIIASQRVPIRSAPQETAKIVSETIPGKEVNVTKDFGPWVEIYSSKGRAGYIPRDAIGDAPLPVTEQKNASAMPEG